LECGGKRYSERRRFCEVKESGAALVRRLPDSACHRTPKDITSDFLRILWFQTLKLIDNKGAKTMKLKIACILIAVVLCVPLFDNAMLCFYKHSQGYLFETGVIKSCATSALRTYQSLKPFLALAPYIGVAAGVFIGLFLSDLLAKRFNS
jgi:hypothetical protein